MIAHPRFANVFQVGDAEISAFIHGAVAVLDDVQHASVLQREMANRIMVSWCPGWRLSG